MAHEVAKLLLEHAGTFLDRQEAIRTCLRLGMPLAEIEEHLDWLDALRGVKSPPPPVASDSDEESDRDQDP